MRRARGEQNNGEFTVSYLRAGIVSNFFLNIVQCIYIHIYIYMNEKIPK